MVIMREISMGRGTGRIGGSITLLAQYLGVLKIALKSTATEALLASAAETRLSEEMARNAVIAQGTVAETELLAASQAQEAKAALAATRANIALRGATVPLNPIFFAVAAGIVAAIGLIVIAYKTWHDIVKQNEEDMIASQEYAEKLRLSIEEEVSALDKLAASVERTNDALRKMNQTKDNFLDLSQAAIKALEDEAGAQAELVDAKTKGKLLDVEIAEAQGAISKKEAIRQKAEIESLAVAGKAKAKQDELDSKAALLDQQSTAADTRASQAQQAAVDAGNKAYHDPGAVIRANELAQEEASNKAAMESAKAERDAAAKTANPKDSAEHTKNAKDFEDIARVGAAQIQNLKEAMHPDEIAASEALERAQQAKKDADHLKEEAAKAKSDSDKFAGQSPAQVAAEIANINKEATLSGIERSGGKGAGILGLTDRQRAGAQIDGPGIALPDVNKRMEKHLARIDANTSGGKRGSPWGGKK